MLRAMLYVQWKAARWPLVPFVLLAFGLPILLLGAARRFGQDGGEVVPAMMLSVTSGGLILFPVLATLVGLAVALLAWSWDHRLGHVYALSLPVSRSRYVLLRMAAGAILLAVPVAALWAGAFVAALSIPVPDGLHVYPLAFGFRFALACLIIYALAFAVAAGTTRTTVIILSALLVFLVFGTVVVDVIEGMTDARGLVRPVDLLYWALVRWPGPFHVFGGSWMLLDV